MKNAPIIVALVLLAGAAHGAADTRAGAILAASKRATGDSAWDRAEGCREEGSHGVSRYTTRFSLRGYGMRIDGERGGKPTAMGFNGIVAWRTDPDGKVMVSRDPAMLSEAILTAYISVNGFYFPDRFPATVEYVRAASEAGHVYDVLDITPKGSRRFEIWFDRDSHFIRRVVDIAGSPPTKVEADGYRTIDGLSIASALTIFGPDGAVVDRGAVASFQCGPVDRAIFDPPADRASIPHR